MNRKTALSLLFSLISLIILQAQNDHLSEQLISYAQAMIDNDYDKMIALTPPALIEKSGGQFYKKEEFRNDKEIRDSQNISYLEFNINIDSPALGNLNEVQSIVEIQFVTSFGNSKFRTFVPILAISKDGGQRWTFVNLEKHDEESIQNFIPSYIKELKFPDRKPAIAIK